MTKTLLNDASYAVYDNAQATKKYDPYRLCQVIDTGVPYFPVTFAYAMPKNSPFFAAFYYHLSQLKEIGAIKRYHDANEGEAQECPDYSGKALSGGQCFTAFIILMIGAGMSSFWLWYVKENTSLRLAQT